MDRLVRLGGDGTPMAAKLCWAEFAIALETRAIALRNQIARPGSGALRALVGTTAHSARQ